LLVCSADNHDASECVELTEREYSVCKAICDASDSISFTQLKQATRLHQEVLSRIVRRLVTHGVITKRGDGRYRSAFT
jgi:DNA-binding IclR family transcriptional regulator